MPNTDNYDIYNSQGVPEALPGSPLVDSNGHLIIPDEHFFPPSTLPNSTMDKDPNNTGPTTEFFSYHPITIDVNGYLFYYDENTGVNVRGPAGAPRFVRFSDLTEEEIQILKGADGANGVNGRNGTNGRDGVDGLDAYHLWLRDNGYTEAEHPIEEFYVYLAGYNVEFIKEGTGQGSLIVNYRGLQNTASGEGSFAAGYHTSASGLRSFVTGLGTVAAFENQFVIGQYNENNSNNIFEIGSGVSTSQRANLLTVTKGGTLTAMGEVKDGENNILSNKVDKIEGKSLSTNDFTDTYKNFIDNYQIDIALDAMSTNPVQNRVIYSALDNIATTIASKPNLEDGTNNDNYVLLSYRTDEDPTKLENAVKLNSITWNPNLKILRAGSSFTGTYQNTYSLGEGLTANANTQTILGKYNTPSATDVFQIGYGDSSVLTKNLLTVSNTGDLTVYKDVIDGQGNILSNKQNLLQYDLIPTQNSSKVMTSGAIYQTLVDVGITPGVGINIPAITVLQTAVASLDTRVTALENSGGIILIDDITGDQYTIGVTDGHFYIQKQEEEESEEDEEEVQGEE